MPRHNKNTSDVGHSQENTFTRSHRRKCTTSSESSQFDLMKFQGAFRVFEFDPKKDIKDGLKLSNSNLFTMSGTQ